MEFLKKSQHYEPLKNRREEDGIMTLIGITLTKIASLAGITNEIDALTRTDIVTMLFSSFKTLSIDEIYFAFQKERYGEYEVKTSHYNLFNADYVSNVLKKFIEWKKSKKTEHNITMESKALLPEISQTQKEKIHYESLQMAYENLKTTGHDDMAWLLYPYVDKKTSLTKEEKKRIYKQEEEKYLKELKTNPEKSIRVKYKTYPKHEQTGRYNSVIQTRCKVRTVIDYIRPHLASFDDFLNALGYTGKRF